MSVGPSRGFAADVIQIEVLASQLPMSPRSPRKSGSGADRPAMLFGRELAAVRFRLPVEAAGAQEEPDILTGWNAEQHRQVVAVDLARNVHRARQARVGGARFAQVEVADFDI